MSAKLQHYPNRVLSGIPGQADVSMGSPCLSCSFLLKRSTNSLWLSSRLKVRLKLVSNTWWTPAMITIIRSDSVRLNRPLSTEKVIFAPTKAFEESSKPPACLTTAEVKVCSEGSSGLRWHRHHHHLLLCRTVLWRENNFYSIPKAVKSNHNQTQLNPFIHLYLVVLQHFKELQVALLRDEDTLSWGDTAAAGQTVIQWDLCFL